MRQAPTRGTDASAQILKIPSNGGGPIAIVSGSNPAWSADGKRLAFISRRSGVPRLVEHFDPQVTPGDNPSWASCPSCVPSVGLQFIQLNGRVRDPPAPL